MWATGKENKFGNVGQNQVYDNQKMAKLGLFASGFQ